ncbi:multiprotein bridging factor aMBF1 [Candidatus Woesearchaeota archaeon]|nr:multiprotein bridging factor aMBF1 [Candidatus Woesearchaeota archaeon]
MTTCDMCGTEKGPFYNAKVEGTDMRVCQNCKRYATEARQVREPQPQKKKKKRTTPEKEPEPEQEERGEIIQIITPQYSTRVKNAREKRGLKQEQLAQQLAEKESLLHAIESGKHEPSMKLARKLEKKLSITLVEHHEEKRPKNEQRRTGPVTIGDLIKKR